jgi:hypothetical protein
MSGIIIRHRCSSIIFLLLILLVLIGVATFLFIIFSIGDTRNRSCASYPTESTVQQSLATHAPTLIQLEQIAPQQIFVSAQEIPSCRGRAKIMILYPSEDDRRRIERVLGPTFFGIPYTMTNV